MPGIVPRGRPGAPPGGEFNIMMANRIMTAVAGGERHLEALKRAALSALSSAA